MAHGLDRIRVLIVDDNHHMVNIVRTILLGLGIKDLSEANDAPEAFDIFKSGPFDLIIVDYAMSFLDGTDFIRLVRTAKDSPNPFIPIIMLTAHSERSKVLSARDAGVTEFCTKPVTAKEIYRKLLSVVNNPRSFVRTATYFGPDRRRRPDPAYAGPERRKPQPVVEDAA